MRASRQRKGPLRAGLFVGGCRPGAQRPADRSSARRSLRRRLGHVDLDPAVLRPARRRGVVGDRLVRAATVDRDARRVDAAPSEILARVGRAVDRQRVVDRVGAGDVGVPDDAHGGCRVRVQRLREAVENRLEIGLDVGATGVERDVARNLELQLVVGGLRNAHAGAGRSLLHRLLLVFHALGPDVGADAAGRCAEHRAGARRAAAATHRAAQRRAHHGADTGADRGALLGFGHVGAARQGGGRHDANQESLLRRHDSPLLRVCREILRGRVPAAHARPDSGWPNRSGDRARPHRAARARPLQWLNGGQR